MTGQGLKTTRTWPEPGAVASSFGRGLAGSARHGRDRQADYTVNSRPKTIAPAAMISSAAFSRAVLSRRFQTLDA